MKKIIRPFSAAVVWIALWFILAYLVGKEVLLPSPADAAKTLLYLMRQEYFWQYCFSSVLRIITGLLAGIAAGSILAIATRKKNFAASLFLPLLSVIRATPVASFIILAFVWIGKGSVPAFTSFLMVLPIIHNAVSVGIQSIDSELLEMTSLFRFSLPERLRYLYIPSVLPSFTSGLNTSLGLAWKAGIAAEVICSPEYGIGTALKDSKTYLNTSELFAWTAAVIIISMLLEKGLGALTAKLSKKYERKAAE